MHLMTKVLVSKIAKKISEKVSVIPISILHKKVSLILVPILNKHLYFTIIGSITKRK